MTFQAYEPTWEWDESDLEVFAYAHFWVESPTHADRRYRIYRHNARKVDVTVEISESAQTVTVSSLSAAFRRAEETWEVKSNDEFPEGLTLTWDGDTAHSIRHDGLEYQIDSIGEGRYDVRPYIRGDSPMFYHRGSLFDVKRRADQWEALEVRFYHEDDEDVVDGDGNNPVGYYTFEFVTPEEARS